MKTGRRSSHPGSRTNLRGGRGPRNHLPKCLESGSAEICKCITDRQDGKKYFIHRNTTLRVIFTDKNVFPLQWFRSKGLSNNCIDASIPKEIKEFLRKISINEEKQ